jgi:hypothetical protein
VSKSFPRWVAVGPKDLCGTCSLGNPWEIWSWLAVLWSLQLELGCGFHLLKSPSKWVPYIMECWLTLIRDFISGSKITIKVASARLVQTSWEHDCHVMDAIRQLETYNDKQLFDINAVRMYL